MNANQLINMIVRLFVRKAVNKGMNAGINRMAGGPKRGQPTPAAKQARRAMKVTRRLNKF
ncbi:hypothetical protein ACSSNL_12960 [Thalassobius sp. S69A]|uniref:hypothetical protein n=1 Tax=unclassified Thalassovita TaxID=2619711 RepID=UPI000C6AFF83|nr:hypothetical protein [Paracoccaceae bacterium]